jgi:hypothetical protein
MEILKKLFYLISLLLISFSCSENLTEPVNITDDELYNLAYSNWKWPENFYSEDSLEGSIYYENTVSIKPLTERENIWIQLCTDNIDTARKWSELSSNYSSYYRELVNEKETEKYFEFKRVYLANPNDVILSRVHKCSYLDRTMYDFFKKESVIGVFSKNIFSENDVKKVIEYIWFVEHYQIVGKVHKSFIEKNNSEYVHYIYEVEIVFGDFGVRDIITYSKNTFSIKINSGEITHKKELIKQIDGKQN